MTDRYVKAPVRNPTAGMRYTKTRKAQAKDQIRDELFGVMERLGIQLSKLTMAILDKRLGAQGLGELRDELRRLADRLPPDSD